MKEILKFDSGADGFKRIVILMGIIAVLILGLGLFFLWKTFGVD